MLKGFRGFHPARQCDYCGGRSDRVAFGSRVDEFGGERRLVTPLVALASNT